MNIRKNQTEKLKKGTKDIEKMNLAKLNLVLQDLKKLDNQVDNDKKDVFDVERRVEDLMCLFRDLIKSVVKDIFNEMNSKMALR